MSFLVLDVKEWAEVNFGSCGLGDVRRTQRAVKLAGQMAEHPDGSTPQQCERWADLKAAYRLFECEEVTFAGLAQPHWQHTRQQARGTVLLIGDTMETDFGIWRDVQGLGPTGDGDGRGFLLHNCLMVEAASGEMIGLAGQELFYRQSAPVENSFRRTQRPRESEVWGRVIDLIGPPADDVQYIHVFDRGADNLEVFCHLIEQHSDWVIRAAQLHRTIYTQDDEHLNLNDLLAQAPVLGTYELHVRKTNQTPARTAKLEVRVAQATLRHPKRMTAYLKQVGFRELTQCVVEAREIDAPRSTDPLRWVLWTSLPVSSFEQAWQVIEHYEQRWLIEEFHKAMKTGCRLESRQYATAQRLESVAGMISVLAVRLVQMKTIARHQPELPAEHVVPQVWLDMLRVLRKRNQIQTIHDFFRHLAGLGGFLMRKGDGEPGWITLWRGLEKLLQNIRGYEAMRGKCG